MGDTIGAFALWMAVGGVGVATLLGPIGQAIARRIAGKGSPPEGLTTGEMNAERVAAMEDRLLALEAERHQLEERLDFTERLLAQAEARQVSPGQGGTA